MGDIIYAALLPHPPLLIPEIGGKEVYPVKKTLLAFREIAYRVKKSGPELVIIFTPHGYRRQDDEFSILGKKTYRGHFLLFNIPAEKIRIGARGDSEFAKEIFLEARKMNLPALTVDEDFEYKNSLEVLMDHGTSVPWYYIVDAGLDIPVISINTASLSREKHYLLGKAISRATAKSKKNIAIIASGDMSHKHNDENFREKAKEFDRMVIDYINRGNIRGFMGMDESFTEEACQCGLNSIIMLYGTLDEKESLKSKVLSYEALFGAGYITAEIFSEFEEDVESDDSFIKLARRSVEEYILNNRRISPDDLKNIPRFMLRDRAGVFVCMECSGELRGCMGTMEPYKENMARELIDNAITCATRDPRFYPLSPEELPYIKFSVDIIKEPEPIESTKEMDPKKYGVIVEAGMKKGLLLPDLEGIGEAERQIEIAKEKGGISPGESVRLYRFEVERHSEK